MSKLIAILLLMGMSVSIAEEIPEYMKDGVITVTLKSGKQYKFSTNEYKVVRRGAKKAPTVLAEKVKQSKKNRIRLLGGTGPSGELTTTQNSTSVTVKTESGLVGGVGYDRKLNDELSIGGQIQTNETFLLNVGFDF